MRGSTTTPLRLRQRILELKSAKVIRGKKTLLLQYQSPKSRKTSRWLARRSSRSAALKRQVATQVIKNSMTGRPRTAKGEFARQCEHPR